MEEELKKLGLQLREWCEKYNKNYVTMYVLNGSVSASISTSDKDYSKLNIYIGKENI